MGIANVQTHRQQYAETLAQLHRLPAVKSYELDSVRSHALAEAA
ncbi:MAG: hypothetical protein AAFY26_13555 [Cyanobacteria bacterium J06638_22]